MTIFALGAGYWALGIVAFAATGALLLWWLGEDEPVREVKAVSKLMRCVQTTSGDTLRDGIRRAFVLSHEHGAVCLLHQGVPVIVSEFSTPERSEKHWQDTARLYERREVCPGK
jgi:hypothetical protein